MLKSTGVSLTVTQDNPPPPPTTYTLTLDKDHAEFLYSLLRHVQTCTRAGNLSYDIFAALRDEVPRRELKLKRIDPLGNVEVDYI